jgi:RimJ/RimL family protein N-acetyltransferase
MIISPGSWVPRARGMGLARESVELLIAWAQSQPGVRAITAPVERDNVASERLLERLGFTRDGEHAEMPRFVLQSTVQRSGMRRRPGSKEMPTIRDRPPT